MTVTGSLSAAQIRLNAVDLINQAGDPSTGGGVAAAIASLLLQTTTTGAAWIKQSAANTAWVKVNQSFAYFSVKDFGAVGDGATDDTTAIQNAITTCAATSGGIVYFPPGIYACSLLTISALANVQLLGSGEGSVLKWVFNAAGGAGSLLTIADGSSRTRISMLQFDGSGLTNPAAGRTNHLVAIGNGSVIAPTIETQIFNCRFTNMVASSGDGVHVLGGAAALVSRTWICYSEFDGCSHFGIGLEQGYEYVWLIDNYLTNCETEVGVVATANLTSNSLSILNNQIVHTSVAVRHAVRLEGPSGLLTRLSYSENIIIGGFVTSSSIKWATCHGNVQTSGDFVSTDAAWRILGAVSFMTCTTNLIDRTSGTSIGPCMSLEKATTSPSGVRLGNNLLVNERQGGGFVLTVDALQCSVGGNVCRSSDAGSSTMFGIDCQAVTAPMTDLLLASNQMSAAAGSMAAGVHVLANGANVTDISVVSNQGDECDYGIAFEIGGGGGVFNGQVLYSGNNFDSTVGDINQIGVTVRPRIGFNAGTFGANLFTGAGSPEGVVTARTGSIYLRTDGGQASTFYYKESGTGSAGWIAIGGAPVIFGAGSAGTAATPLFMANGWIAAAQAAEIQVPLTRPGTLRNLRVQVGGAGTDAATVTFTVRINGIDTVLTCNISNTATGLVADLTHTVAVTAGQLLSISIVKTGAVTAGQTIIGASLEIV